MAIYPLKRKKGIIYRVRLMVEGRKVSRNFTRKIDAQQFENQARITPVETRSISFLKASEEWMQAHAEVRKAKSSIKSDKVMLRLHILPAIGNMKLHTIRPPHIDQIIRSLKNKGLADGTVDKNLQLIKAVFNFHLKRGVIYYNPMVAIRLLNNKEQPYKYWSRPDAQKFLEHTAKKYVEASNECIHVIYKLALNSGMRQGELIGLKWSDVNFDKGLIRVCRVYSKHERRIVETTKGRKVRHIPIDDAVFNDLLRIKANRASGDLVFHLNGYMIDPDNLYHRHFLKDIEAAGVERIRFHDLRHTFASHYMMNGGNRFELQKFLGHSDAKLTERYAHLSLDYIASKTNIVSLSEGGKVIHADFRQAVG